MFSYMIWETLTSILYLIESTNICPSVQSTLHDFLYFTFHKNPFNVVSDFWILCDTGSRMLAWRLLSENIHLSAEVKEFIDALYKMFQMVMHEMF